MIKMTGAEYQELQDIVTTARDALEQAIADETDKNYMAKSIEIKSDMFFEIIKWYNKFNLRLERDLDGH